MSNKKLYTVRHPDCTQFTVNASSAQSACRKAFKFWINQKELKCQPKTTLDGGFENVEVLV